MLWNRFMHAYSSYYSQEVSVFILRVCRIILVQFSPCTQKNHSMFELLSNICNNIILKSSQFGIPGIPDPFPPLQNPQDVISVSQKNLPSKTPEQLQRKASIRAVLSKSSPSAEELRAAIAASKEILQPLLHSWILRSRLRR